MVPLPGQASQEICKTEKLVHKTRKHDGPDRFLVEHPLTLMQRRGHHGVDIVSSVDVQEGGSKIMAGSSKVLLVALKGE